MTGVKKKICLEVRVKKKSGDSERSAPSKLVTPGLSETNRAREKIWGCRLSLSLLRLTDGSSQRRGGAHRPLILERGGGSRDECDRRAVTRWSLNTLAPFTKSEKKPF